jgi:hypothetical protein
VEKIEKRVALAARWLKFRCRLPDVAALERLNNEREFALGDCAASP